MNRELLTRRVKQAGKIGFAAFLIKGLLWLLLPLLWLLLESPSP